MLTKALARLHGYLETGYFVASRLSALADRQLRLELHRQVHRMGVSAVLPVLAMALVVGLIAVNQLTALLGPQSEQGQTLLFYMLVVEAGPVLCALLMIARTSSSVAAELAIMHLHHEFQALYRMRVPAANFLLVPKVVAYAMVLPALALVFQAVSATAGSLAFALWHQQDVGFAMSQMLAFADAGLFLASMLKCAVTGAVLGVIACYHGCSEPQSSQAISDASVHTVGASLVAAFLIDLGFAVMAVGLKG